MRFRWDRPGKAATLGCALVIAVAGACSEKDGSTPFTAGGAGESTGGKARGGGSGGGGSSAGGKNSAGAPGTGGKSAGGGSAAESSGSPNGGSPGSEGGASDGGNSVTSAGESSSAGEGSGGSADRPSWCPELDACRYGADQRREPGAECPVGRDCYGDVWCGKSVQCVRYVDDGTCTEKPACDEGQLSSPICSGLGICETRSACGKSVVCESYPPEGAACQPGLQRDRVFAAAPEQCSAFSIGCPEGSAPFVDEKCGCGCEQPADCPDSVNCQPTTSGETRSKLCDTEECPFTERTQ
jgi:hypothetical protein